MSDTRLLSLTSVQTTSAQIALVLAMSLYYNLFNSLSPGDFYENGELSSEKIELFKRRLEAILNALISQESVTEAPHPMWDRIKSLPRGKLKYFDENHKLLITNEASKELDYLLRSLSVENETDIHILNQFTPRKSAPLGATRIAVTASVFNTITSLLIFGAVLDEHEYLLIDHPAKMGIEDASSITLTLLFSFVVAANVLQRVRQERTYDVASEYTGACIAALNTMGLADEIQAFPTSKHYQQVIKDASILGFKGAISTEASKQRSRMTLGAAVVFSVVFLLLDVFSVGGFLGVRIGLGLAAAITIMITRYVTKTEQNKVNLYAKEQRSWITSAFQGELMAELRVYGLQPVDSTKEISSDTVDVQRQVSVDVESFLESNKDAITEIVDKNGLSDAMSWIKKNIPTAYRQHPDYFLGESELHIREKHLNEDRNMIHAERVRLFVKPVDQFFSRQQARGIKHLHDHIMLYQSQTEGGKSYLYDRVSNMPEDSEVHQKIKGDLAWNPWISARRLVTPDQEVRRELSWTMGYTYYAATRFSVAPWQSDEKVLEAYYTKRCQAAKKKLMEEKNKDAPGVKASSSDIFKAMLDKDEQDYKYESRFFGKKSLKAKHEENMAGVGISSILASGATVLFLAISPAFACAAHLLYVCSDLVSDVIFKVGAAVAYLGASSFFKTGSIYHRRSAKTEERYKLLSQEPA